MPTIKFDEFMKSYIEKKSKTCPEFKDLLKQDEDELNKDIQKALRNN